MSNLNLTGRRGITFCLSSLLIIAVAYGVKKTIFASSPVNSTNTLGAKSQLTPTIDSSASTKTTGKQTIVLAGGCFWGVEAVFEKLQGVSTVVSGYAGGNAETANYGAVSGGATGHAEAVQITYDPQQISLGQLLKVFFAVAHDPTEVDRQGPDQGTQYRSAIFFADAEQQKIAQAYITKLNQGKVFSRPIATKLTALTKFYPAEEHHQDFIAHNPTYPYVVVHDLPKLDQLQQQFPELVKR
jgi:peptide-methionine (S)-S-oxide reductase